MLLPVALSAALFSYAAASCTTINSNTYCEEVEQVIYSNVGFSGSYSKITDMSSSGTCSSSSFSFSGSLAPLNEEVTIHFRGPLNLKNFAHYSVGSSNSKRDSITEPVEQTIQKRGHVHHMHKREAEPVLVTEFVEVTTTIFLGGNQGQAVTSVISVASTAEVESSSSEAVSSSSSKAASAASSAASSASSSSSSSSSNSGSSAGASYCASAGTKSNVVFMNNMGGSGSGVFDYVFGNSVSFAGSDGVSCASESTLLDDVTIPSNKEFILFSGEECSGDDCGYYRDGIPAYHGFSTDNSVFVFEFSMPHDDDSGFNGDMPAIWFLNAEIPRTLQYGISSCSCWATGCGEFDVFEILGSGLDYLTSHLHSGQGSTSSTGSYGGGGTTSYFARPTDGTLTAAVYFDSDNSEIVITKVPDSFDFSSTVTLSTVKSWISEFSGSSTTVDIS